MTGESIYETIMSIKESIYELEIKERRERLALEKDVKESLEVMRDAIITKGVEE